MIELPEAHTLARQTQQTLTGKVITDVLNATHLHKFTFFSGDPRLYKALLKGREVESSYGRGIFVDIVLSGGAVLSIFDGVNMRYGDKAAAVPGKYQLLVTFDDDTFLAFTTTMYGGIYAFEGAFDNKYRNLSLASVSPLSDAFDEAWFDDFFRRETKNIPAKALLATEQRIPGVGNGVLQDILFNAGIHPKRKIFTLADPEKSALFHSLKITLGEMTERGGRDTETDLFGHRGGYRTLLSKNTFSDPCPRCGDQIRKEAFLGGSVYYCPTCQKL